MSTIVIMPGGFHPFHAGHMALYNSARQAFPDADLYVAATNSQEERPFPFSVKEKLAKVAGVEPGHFVQVKSPFQAKEITQHYNPEQDVLNFVRSEKDKNESPKPGGIKKDGSPAYFQPYTGKDMQPFGKHAYFAYLPTVKFGPGITSATEIRKAWPTLDDRRKTAMVMSLYPAAQKNQKLAANIVAMLDQVMGDQQSVPEGLNEFAAGGDFKPPVPPKSKGNDPFGNDDRSKIVQAVRQLLKAGNKVDWKVPGQMGHVVRADDHGVVMKRWGRPYSKIHYSLHLTDDQDDQYQIMMVKPGYYKVISTDSSWNLEEQVVAEGKIKDIEDLLARHAQYYLDKEQKEGPLSGQDIHSRETIRKQLIAKKKRLQAEKDRTDEDEKTEIHPDPELNKFYQYAQSS